jgi:hypothetical protein
MHIIPSGEQTAVAGELFVPVGMFDLTSELVYSQSDTREAVDGYQLTPFTERLGLLKGIGYYVLASAWITGDRSIVGFPGYSKPQHVDLTKEDKAPRTAIQLLAKIEQLSLTYQSAKRSGVIDSTNADGDIRMTALSFGANYWATRHLRVSANYGYDYFPSSAPVTASTKGGRQQTSNERALAPAQNLAKGVEDSARNNSHALHELQFRVGVQF